MSPVVFPVLHPNELIIPPKYMRTRSRTGPSKWDPAPLSDPSYDSFDLVAAPVSGVETMDALVDGMNGGHVITPRSSVRSRLGAIPNHHPLYQPPLPTPPPGIVLGGAKIRKPQQKVVPHSTDDDDDDDDDSFYTPTSSRSRKRRHRPGSSRTVSNSTITTSSNFTHQDSDDHDSLHSYAASHKRTTSKDTNRKLVIYSRHPSRSESPKSIPDTFHPKQFPRPLTSSSVESRKVDVPSISEIVRNFAPPSAHITRPYNRSSSLYTPSSHGHSTIHDDPESEPDTHTRAPTTTGPEEEEEEEDTEFPSRSSIDSVADEVQRTIRNQNQIRLQPRSLPPPTPTTTFKNRYSIISDNSSSIYSPRSDPGGAPSVYSFSAPSSYFASSPLDSTFLNMSKPTAPQAVAQYLRSARLTTLLKLTRSPHASADNPLTVSLSDLGSPNGFPVVVFLGLGCVRHMMGLYDEMAQCMGLRLITIDRWGLGRTEPRSKSAKGIIQWAAAVEEVLDVLRIERCSVMAHSAGAPYALSFANRIASRIRGDICLLAPWVGGSENNGYKWLKYVPNSILKTAQAAEWKIQAWMIGKPPTLTYEGIGYTLPVASKQSSERSSPVSNGTLNVVYPSAGERHPRPSIGSSSLSEYDDLRDFEGRFESRSTLALPPPGKPQDGGVQFKRKPSKGIFERLKGSSPTSSSSQNQEKSTSAPLSSTKKLRALTSMGSLRNRVGHASRKSEPSSPQLPPTLKIDVGLGLEDMSWVNKVPVQPEYDTPRMVSNGSLRSGSGCGSGFSNPRRRSISFTSSTNATSLGPPLSPSTSVLSSTVGASGSGSGLVAAQNSEANFQAQLGNALIAASHAESSKGTTNDLLQILNHENHSWGFSYANYPHRARVWYGDKDEKIAENAVRWMEKTMGPERCSVKVVKGADHGLMYRTSAVVDVLEWIQSAWRDHRTGLPFSEFRR